MRLDAQFDQLDVDLGRLFGFGDLGRKSFLGRLGRLSRGLAGRRSAPAGGFLLGARKAILGLLGLFRARAVELGFAPDFAFEQRNALRRFLAGGVDLSLRLAQITFVLRVADLFFDLGRFDCELAALFLVDFVAGQHFLDGVEMGLQTAGFRPFVNGLGQVELLLHARDRVIADDAVAGALLQFLQPVLRDRDRTRQGQPPRGVAAGRVGERGLHAVDLGGGGANLVRDLVDLGRGLQACDIGLLRIGRRKQRGAVFARGLAVAFEAGGQLIDMGRRRADAVAEFRRRGRAFDSRVLFVFHRRDVHLQRRRVAIKTRLDGVHQHRPGLPRLVGRDEGIIELQLRARHAMGVREIGAALRRQIGEHDGELLGRLGRVFAHLFGQQRKIGRHELGDEIAALPEREKRLGDLGGGGIADIGETRDIRRQRLRLRVGQSELSDDGVELDGAHGAAGRKGLIDEITERAADGGDGCGVRQQRKVALNGRRNEIG